MKITDDSVKTRAQKEKLDEITSPTTEDKPRLPREGTMAVTAKVYSCVVLLLAVSHNMRNCKMN